MSHKAPISRDPLAGKYIQRGYFGRDFATAIERLAPLGGHVIAGTADYEAFIYEAPGCRLIFYPHRTTAGNYHIRVRRGGPCDPKKLRAAIFALAENSCTFGFPTEPELHRQAVRASIDRMYSSSAARSTP